MNRPLTVLIAATGVAAIGVPAAFHPAPKLIWNTTASAPVGLYTVHTRREPRVGDLVVVRPPALLARSLADAGFLPFGVPLLKHIAALTPSIVCRAGADVTIDGVFTARALPRDRFARPLRTWSGCERLRPNQIFLLNAEPRSLDSRYFGPLPAHLIVGQATPILVTGGRSHVS